jgi:hypothetical protein
MYVSWLQEWDVLAEVTVPSPGAAAGTASTEAPSNPLLLSATLAWRGDSKYFATNTLWQTTSSSRSGACRLLHIWDREDCQLHSTAQAAAGLAAPIAWQPNSRHLYAAAAVAQDLQHQAAATAGFDSRGQPLKAAPHQQPGVPSWPAVEAAAAAAGGGSHPQQQQQQASSVVDAAGGSWLQHVLLYERNGLQHGGFDVPTYSQAGSSSSSSSSSGLVIHALHWSSDSELLAVVLAPAGAGRQRAADESSNATHEWHVQVRAWACSGWLCSRHVALLGVRGLFMVCMQAVLLLPGRHKHKNMHAGYFCTIFMSIPDTTHLARLLKQHTLMSCTNSVCVLLLFHLLSTCSSGTAAMGRVPQHEQLSLMQAA